MVLFRSTVPGRTVLIFDNNASQAGEFAIVVVGAEAKQSSMRPYAGSSYTPTRLSTPLGGSVAFAGRCAGGGEDWKAVMRESPTLYQHQ